MIVDCHVHIGTIGPFDMPERMVLDSLDAYQIDFALVSNIEGCEVDTAQNRIPPDRQQSQRKVNERTLRFVRAHPDRLAALFWIKPATEGCTPEFASLVADNRDVVVGLKVHPFFSKLSFDSPQMDAYMQLAQEQGLGVVTHTAADDESSPQAVFAMARRYPAVNVIMYHMGLDTDNQEAIELIARLPNLYGDVSWVPPQKGLQAIRTCGSHKILFGSDNPIDGPDTYDDPDYYRYYFGAMQDDVDRETYERFMAGNAVRLFKLDRLSA